MTFPQPIVSIDWLAEHLHQPNLIVLDASLAPPGQEKPDLSSRCIPAAQSFDIEQRFPSNSGLPHTLPDEHAFSAVAQQCGINPDSYIVVYEYLGLFSAARAWWMFRAMGHEHVAVLDGGLPAWQQAGLPLSERYLTSVPRGSWQGRLDHQQVVSHQQVLAALQQGQTNVLDARSAERFFARVEEPRPGLRSGHMPGAFNLPFNQLLEQGRLLPPQQLRQRFAQLALHDGPFIFSCGSGVTACILFLAAELCGYSELAIYDGSWSEWGADPSLPVVTD